jgi:type III secretion system FlhB-like substrate exporter
LPFITLHIHRSLYDYGKSGQPAGVIAAGQAVEINQKIIDLLKPLDVFVRIDSKLEHLLEGYDK